MLVWSWAVDIGCWSLVGHVREMWRNGASGLLLNANSGLAEWQRVGVVVNVVALRQTRLVPG